MSLGSARSICSTFYVGHAQYSANATLTEKLFRSRYVWAYFLKKPDHFKHSQLQSQRSLVKPNLVMIKTRDHTIITEDSTPSMIKIQASLLFLRENLESNRI
jgi:uncharacterized protein YchJ